MKPCAPILVIAFNRPSCCKKVFDAIRFMKPGFVFFAVDGPRKNHPTDPINCQKTRDLQHIIDWPCKIQTLFREDNRGCRNAPPEAISWFFKHVDRGIILEDDCVPSQDFLIFVSELLERYANTDDIGMISGDNWYGYQTNRNESYHFTRYPYIWGWATWRRAWNLYDVSMTPYLKQLDSIRNSLGHSDKFRVFWWRFVDSVLRNPTTWDVQWAIALLANNKICIQPRCNLISNIGFTPDSTHTSYEYDALFFLQTQPLEFPLVHPFSTIIDERADIKKEKRYISLWRRGMTYIGAKGGSIGKQVASLFSRIEAVYHNLF